jgi:hypothetical protein
MTRRVRRGPLEWTLRIIVALLLVAVAVLVGGLIRGNFGPWKTASPDTTTTTSTTAPASTSTSGTVGADSTVGGGPGLTDDQIEGACAYGGGALVQLQGAQGAPPAQVYADTPQITYVVRLSSASGPNIPSDSFVNKLGADATTLFNDWSALQRRNAPPVSKVVSDLQAVLNDCASGGFPTGNS